MGVNELSVDHKQWNEYKIKKSSKKSSINNLRHLAIADRTYCRGNQIFYMSFFTSNKTGLHTVKTRINLQYLASYKAAKMRCWAKPDNNVNFWDHKNLVVIGRWSFMETLVITTNNENVTIERFRENKSTCNNPNLLQMKILWLYV